MKHLFLTLFCLVLGTSICEAKKSSADSVVLSREIRLNTPYTGLRVGDMIQVFLEAARDPCLVRIETEGVSADRVRAEVHGRTLVLACDRKAFRKAARKRGESIRGIVRIGIGTLASFDCSEMSVVRTDASIVQPTVEIRCEGMSEVSLDIDCRSLYLNLGTGSKYRGRAVCSENAQIEASGMSTVTTDLQCGALSLMLSSHAECHGKAECGDLAQIAAMDMSTVASYLRCASLYMELSNRAEFNGTVNCCDKVCIAAQTGSHLCADFTCRNALLELDGHSSYRGELACRDARIALSDMSDCSPAGTTQELLLETSGMSEYAGSHFTVTGSASCLAAGMSTVLLRCTGELVYEVSQRSKLVYWGGPNVRASVVENGDARPGSGL